MLEARVRAWSVLVLLALQPLARELDRALRLVEFLSLLLLLQNLEVALVGRVVDVLALELLLRDDVLLERELRAVDLLVELLV